MSLVEILKQFISNHWRGAYPAVLAIAVLLLGLRFLIGFIPYTNNQIATTLIVAASLLILVWQVLGTWRCIERHLRATGETMLYWAGCLAIVVAIVLTLLHTIDLVVGPPPKITKESLRKMPLPKLSDDGSTVFLKGEINFDLNNDLLSLVKENKKLKTVELSSNGGFIYAARALAFSIEKNGLNTHVEGECNSACTLVFMAGDERTLGIAGKIGFHQYEFKKQHPLQVEKANDEQERDLKFFARRGISSGFLESMYQSGHQNIWQPDRSVLREAGVITQD